MLTSAENKKVVLKRDPFHSSSRTPKKTTQNSAPFFFFFADSHRVQPPWRSSEGGDTHIHWIIPPSDTAFRDKAYVLQQAGDTELTAQSGAKRTAGIFSPDQKTMDTLRHADCVVMLDWQQTWCPNP